MSRGTQLTRLENELESLKEELKAVERAVPQSEANAEYVFKCYVLQYLLNNKSNNNICTRIINYMSQSDESFTEKNASLHWKTKPMRGPCFNCTVS